MEISSHASYSFVKLDNTILANDYYRNLAYNLKRAYKIIMKNKNITKKLNKLTQRLRKIGLKMNRDEKIKTEMKTKNQNQTKAAQIKFTTNVKWRPVLRSFGQNLFGNHCHATLASLVCPPAPPDCVLSFSLFLSLSLALVLSPILKRFAYRRRATTPLMPSTKPNQPAQYLVIRER